jgi:DNA uptake protein ComE-like DNA-binding protein
MTERIENVDPPFDRRCIQVTLAVIASAAFGCLLITSWHTPSRRQHPPAAEFGGPALIQIDLNGAEARELALLPGVGPVLAKRIAENRDRLGLFDSVDELRRVHGIGPKTLFS